MKRNRLFILFSLFVIALLNSYGQCTFNAYSIEGYARLNRQNYTEAITFFNLALEKDSACAELYVGRATANLGLKHFTLTHLDLEYAIRIKPNYAMAYFQRALLEEQANEDYIAAIQNYNKIIDQCDTMKFDAYLNRSNCKFILKDVRGCIADCDEAIKLNPLNYLAYFNRGTAKAVLGQTDEALSDLDFSIKIRASNGKAYYTRANVKLQKGDKNGACLDWSKAGELGIKDAYRMIKEVCN